jgi:hypothetical protein
VLNTKWDFTIKHSKDGSIRKFKARRVVRGLDQRVGMDFNKERLYVNMVSSLLLEQRLLSVLSENGLTISLMCSLHPY